MSQAVNIMYIFIHSCDNAISVICNLCYTVHWFCLGVGDYPLSVGLLNPSVYFLFPPGVKAVVIIKPIVVRCVFI